VAALSASYAWTFAAIGQNSYALLWKSNRWHTYQLADSAYLSTSVAFSATSAWAFGSIGAAGYAARFNGKTWRQVPIPVVPQDTADPTATNIWAVGPLASSANKPSPQPFALAHWTGHWRTIRFPNLHLPPGAHVDYASVVAENGGSAFVAAGISSKPGWVLLLWTGSTWAKAKISGPVDEILAMARDGHGGLWIASVPAGFTCVNAQTCEDIDMLHRSASGTWTHTIVKVANLGLTAMRLIPGGQSIWATGSITGGADDDFSPVMIKYGP
jgi:hypothetical protein